MLRPGGSDASTASSPDASTAAWPESSAPAEGPGSSAPAAGPPPDPRLDALAAAIAAAPLNLVSARDRGLVRSVHVEEAVAVGRLLAPAPGAQWLDLGTGGGLPGLVLAVAYPDTTWTLLDATEKKVVAVAGIAAELGLTNVRTVAGRAESHGQSAAHRQRYDGVVSRAVARLDVLAEYCRGFVRPGGLIAAIKGPAWEQEMAGSAHALHLLSLTDIHSAAVLAAHRPTWLVTMRANGPAPAAYPRPEGVPRRSPLGRF